MSENERVELAEVEALVEATNAIAVSNPIRQELICTLSPVAGRMARYEQLAGAIKVNSQAEADEAAQIDAAIALDIKSVEGNDVLSKIIRGLDQLHGKAVAVRSLFVIPMKTYRKTIRQPVLDWEARVKREADEIQRKLQAEADAKAQREREKQEAESRRQRQIEEDARRKAEDARRTAAEEEGAERARLEAAANAADRAASAAAVKAETRTEQAAAVIAPTVTVAAAKSGLRVSKAWVVKSVNQPIFFAALATRFDLRGFVEINTMRLARAKAANPSQEIPGIEFTQIVR